MIELRFEFFRFTFIVFCVSGGMIFCPKMVLEQKLARNVALKIQLYINQYET